MRARRTGLLARLDSAPGGEVETVNDSLDVLRSAFAELEHDAGQLA